MAVGTVGFKTSVEEPPVTEQINYLKYGGRAGAVLLLVGLVALVVILSVQGVVKTRTDLMRDWSSKVTNYVSPMTRRLLIAVSAGCAAGAIVSLALLGDAIQRRDSVGKKVCVTMALILSTIAVVGLVACLGQSTTSSNFWERTLYKSEYFSRSYYYYTPSSFTVDVLNFNGLEAFKKAAIVLASVGAATLLVTYGLYRKQNAEKQLATHVERMNGRS